MEPSNYCVDGAIATLRFERCDWKYFDMLLLGASPISGPNLAAEARLDTQATRPPSVLSPKVIPRPVCWSSDEKLHVLTIWRACKYFLRRKRNLNQNILWMKTRRSRSWFLQWLTFVMHKRERRMALESHIRCIKTMTIQHKKSHYWRLWRYEIMIVDMIRGKQYLRSRTCLKQSWQQWRRRIQKWQAQQYKLYIAMKWWMRLMWRHFLQGCYLQRHARDQGHNLARWKLQRWVRCWHICTRSSRELHIRFTWWQKTQTRERCKTLWGNWRMFCRIRNVKRIRVQELLRYKLRQRWHIWMRFVSLQVSYIQT
jgi:hypothetical protein